MVPSLRKYFSMSRQSGRLFVCMFIAVVLSISVFSGGTARSVFAARPYAGAANGNTVLILGTSVNGG
ncbi:MAG: hypothetical protein ABFD14_07595, partial [Anaerolineaceae bacterium]